MNSRLIWEWEWDDFFRRMYAAEEVAFDIETTGFDKFKNEIVGASFFFNEEVGYVPLTHRRVVRANWDGGELWDSLSWEYEKIPEQVELGFFVHCMHRLLEREDLILYGHNLKFDLGWMYVLFRKQGLSRDVKCSIRDSESSSYLCMETVKKLKVRVEEELGYRMDRFDEVCVDPEFSQDMNPQDMESYACDDAEYSYKLAQLHTTRMDPKQLKLWTDLEGPTTTVLTHMEHVGCFIDQDKLQELHEYYKTRLDEFSAPIHEIIGDDVNLNSPTQLSTRVWDELEIWDHDKLARELNKKKTRFKRGDSGLFTTGAEVVGEVIYYEAGTEEGIRVAEALRMWRKYDKLLSTYTGKIPQMIDRDGRLRTKFKQSHAITGRLSSAEPNLQNVPSRFDDGARIREAFIAEPGWRILDLDYSQMELRVLAHVSRDPGMIECFFNGEDPHQQTADLLNVERSIGKTLNFAVLYGQGAKRLCRSLKISHREAKEYIENFLDTKPGVRAYIELQKRRGSQLNEVWSILGRKRNFTQDKRYGLYWKNKAVNFPIQSSAGDICKVAMRNIYNWLRDSGLLYNHVNMLLQVHDELVFEVREEVAEMVKEKVADLMRNAVKLRVPIDVDGEIADSWAEAH